MRHDNLFDHRFILLFAGVLLLVAVMPLLSREMLVAIPFVMIVLMIGVYRVLSLPRSLLMTFAAIGILAAVLHLGAVFVRPDTGDSATQHILMVLGLISYCLFFGIGIIGLLAGILRQHRITHDTIRGSLSVYLLIGVWFALLYRLVYVLKPTEFASSILPGTFSEFLYFSFTTLTTLGYGDISPVGPLSRSLTTLEAIAGPVFLTVLVSRLVGHFVSTSSENEAAGPDPEADDAAQ